MKKTKAIMIIINFHKVICKKYFEFIFFVKIFNYKIRDENNKANNPFFKTIININNILGPAL